MFTPLIRFIRKTVAIIQKTSPVHRYQAMDFILGAALLPGFLIDPFYGVGAVVIIIGSNHFLEALRKYQVSEPGGFKKKPLHAERNKLIAGQSLIYFSLVTASFALGFYNEGNIVLSHSLISALGMAENPILAKNILLSLMPLMGVSGIYFGSNLRKHFFPGLYKQITDPQFSSIVTEHASLILQLEHGNNVSIDFFENTADEFGLLPITKAIHYDQLTASKALIERGATVPNPILVLYLQKIEEESPPAENDPENHFSLRDHRISN